MKSILTAIFSLILISDSFCSALPPIQTVFVIIFENNQWLNIKDSTNAPYINNVLLPMASYCEGYYGLPGVHPSLPNYIWLEAGTNFGIFDDNDPAMDHQNTTNHIVTQLNNSGIPWKVYQQWISGTTLPLTSDGAVSCRHNPVLYFDDVTGTNNPTYPYGLAHIRPYSEFGADLTNDTVARYNLLVFDDCNDMHTACNPLTNQVLQGDVWLSAEIPKILNSRAYNNGGAIFITFDESYGPEDRIGMIVLSPYARGGGYNNAIYYNHSSTLRTLQEIFGVGPFLGAAANATDLSDLFYQFGIQQVVRMPSGAVHLKVAGITPGTTNIIEASTNLSTWTPISTNVAGSSTFTVIDSDASTLDRRFYRLLQLP